MTAKVTGYRPLDDNYIASLAFGSVCLKIKDLINREFEKYENDALAEPSFLGYILALRGVVSAAETRREIDVRMVEAWKDRYIKWHKRFGSGIKVARGVSRDKLLEMAVCEFDNLIRAIRGEPIVKYSPDERKH